jgi:hypothetical protein
MSFIDGHPKEIFRGSEFSFPMQDWMTRLITGSQIEIQGRLVNTPDGSAQYQGCWMRDFTMLCESGHPMIDAEYMKRGLDLMFANQGPNGEIPDWVPYDSKKHVIYALFNKHPFLDNPLWLVRLMCLYLEKSDNVNYFIRNEDKLFSGLRSMNLLNPQHFAVNIDPGSHQDDWGFTDCIMKTGTVLFSSLLKLDAIRSLATIYGLMDEPEKYQRYYDMIPKIISELEILFDPDQNLYYAASGYGHQIDIWGNAFAVYLGLLSSDRTQAVAHALYKNRERFVWNGQIRHLFKGEYWDHFLPGAESLGRSPNTYQNGAYWGTPTGWMAVAFEKAQPGTGKQLMQNLFEDYQQFGINECVYPQRWRFGKRYQKCPHYVASLALPFRLLKFD